MKSNDGTNRLSNELERIKGVIHLAGFSINENQPHISGERFLMTREKLVLLGIEEKTGKKVVLKISDHESGKKEITHDKKTRDALEKISFTEDTILFPKEIYFNTIRDFLILVTEYIPQETVFVKHPIKEQFFMILNTLEIMENFHATTYEHIQSVKNILPVFYAKEYFENFGNFISTFNKYYKNGRVGETLTRAQKFLVIHKILIDKYSNYLTHEDFAPHNFRVYQGKIYVLDTSAFRFGNKYDGWARFLNYMVIHNPTLERLLIDYIKSNRGEEEYLMLRLMRIYKVGELLEYYGKSLQKTEGDLKTLTIERINFWHNILLALLDGMTIEEELVRKYIDERNKLRSEEEKERQREFAVA